jgi:hypothetical protein
MIDPLVTTVALMGFGLTGTAAGLVRQTRARRALADRAVSLEGRLAAAEQRLDVVQREFQHLVERRLPTLVDVVAREHSGVSVPGLVGQELVGTSVEACHQAVLDLCQEAVTVTRESVALASRAAVRDTLDEAQTFLIRCQMKAVDEMDKYPQGMAYHQSLMDLDHLVTLAVHTVQRTRILTGSWPGLQRADCTVREIIESARGRTDAYQRIAYTYEPATGELWVEGRAVEPVTVALTELLGNALGYSEGKVSAEVQQTQTGLCVVVDDRGLGMSTYQRQEAARRLSQQEVLDVTTLPDTLHLGFPVIGRLAGEYGFHADVSSTSPYGGVRAVLRIPRELFGHGPTEEEKAAERQAALAAVSAPTAAELPEEKPAPGQASPLPQRRRRQPRVSEPAPLVGESAPQEDPDAFSLGFANLTAVIREGEGDENHPEGEHPQ